MWPRFTSGSESTHALRRYTGLMIKYICSRAVISHHHFFCFNRNQSQADSMCALQTESRSSYSKRVTLISLSCSTAPAIFAVDGSGDSSLDGSGSCLMTRHLCLILNSTHFGQNQLQHLLHICLNLGFPPPHASPLHLDLLEFFLTGRSAGML